MVLTVHSRSGVLVVPRSRDGGCGYGQLGGSITDVARENRGRWNPEIHCFCPKMRSGCRDRNAGDLRVCFGKVPCPSWPCLPPAGMEPGVPRWLQGWAHRSAAQREPKQTKCLIPTLRKKKNPSAWWCPRGWSARTRGLPRCRLWRSASNAPCQLP